MRQKLLLALALALLSPAAATLTRTHVARPVRRLAQSEAGECKGPHAEFCRDECKNNKKKNSRKRCKDKCRAACRETGLYHKDPMKTCPIAFWAGEYTTEPLSRHGLEVMAGSQLSGPAMYYKINADSGNGGQDEIMRARFQCGADVLEDNGKVGSPGDASYVHNSNCENEKNVPALCSALIWTNDLEMRCTDTQELGKTQFHAIELAESCAVTKYGMIYEEFGASCDSGYCHTVSTQAIYERDPDFPSKQCPEATPGWTWTPP